MAWEEQGCQYHGWFGTGTAGVDVADGSRDSLEDRASAVVRGAASFMPRGLAQEFQSFVGRNPGRQTLLAMEAWSAAAHLPIDQFGRLVGGRTMGNAAIASLKAMSMELSPSGDTEAASRHLAAAVMDGGRVNAIYRYADAQDRAFYAEANGLVPEKPVKAEVLPALKQDKSIVLAAGGSLRCEGFSGGCQSGGSWGTTATHIVLGISVCRSCAIKLLGIGSLGSAEQSRILRDYER